MTEEEKKAVEELKEFIKGPCETCKFCAGAYKLNRKNVIYLLNIIKKLQKETIKYKNMYESEHKIHLVRNEQLDRKQNAITKCNELQIENEQLRTEMNSLQKENKELNKKLILQKGIGDYWCEAYIELQKEYQMLKNTKTNCPILNTSGAECKLKQIEMERKK